MAHFIRLREAWNVERPDESNGSRSVKLTRQFGCSSGLKTASRVWLSIEDVAGCASVELNGNILGQIANSRNADDLGGQRCPAKFEITALLQPRNALTVEVSPAAEATAPQMPEHLGLVQLEIE